MLQLYWSVPCGLTQSGEHDPEIISFSSSLLTFYTDITLRYITRADNYKYITFSRLSKFLDEKKQRIKRRY
jgi:hypothetical protein